MPTIADLHELHLRQLETVVAESKLLLQKEGGLDGELRSSGAICEKFIRDTLKTFVVPGHFRITSGFVATPTLLARNANLPQSDILLVDRDSLPILRLQDSSIEVVPQEVVCGIIEAKRTLTRNALDQALVQIGSVIASFDNAAEFKSDAVLNRFNRNVGFHNHSSDKPLLGVVALRREPELTSEDVVRAIRSAGSLVDIVWTLDGFALVPSLVTAERTNYYTHTARPRTCTWADLTLEDFHSASSPFYRAAQGVPKWTGLQSGAQRTPSDVFSRVRGLVSLMLSRVVTRAMQEDEIAAYYVRE